MADYPIDSEGAEWEDFQQEQRERQEETWDEFDETAGAFPTQKKVDTIASLFKDIWRTSDSTKVANINPKTELGDLGLSVRHLQKMAVAAEILNETSVSKWMDSLGEITLATSMSKNGWFPELFVSTKKFTQKSSNIANLGGHAEKKGWRLFGGKKETATEEQ